ncbi:hypothetical protein PR048_021378 [Dryococelus australis]|uniref:Uncharacterized protein n=1 Tax=Dryococelus australis TaxID=614101 RepID=A0ABQ9GY17_9NEOP|nr:hypothetical protein PR048_021378 [Dryococelus australis]
MFRPYTFAPQSPSQSFHQSLDDPPTPLASPAPHALLAQLAPPAPPHVTQDHGVKVKVMGKGSRDYCQSLIANVHWLTIWWTGDVYQDGGHRPRRLDSQGKRSRSKVMGQGQKSSAYNMNTRWLTTETAYVSYYNEKAHAHRGKQPRQRTEKRMLDGSLILKKYNTHNFWKCGHLPPRMCSMRALVGSHTNRPIQYVKGLLTRKGLGGLAARVLASHQGEPGLIPGEVAPGFLLVGIMVGEFSRGSPISPALAFRRCSISISFSALKTSLTCAVIAEISYEIANNRNPLHLPVDRDNVADIGQCSPWAVSFVVGPYVLQSDPLNVVAWNQREPGYVPGEFCSTRFVCETMKHQQWLLEVRDEQVADQPYPRHVRWVTCQANAQARESAVPVIH